MKSTGMRGWRPCSNPGSQHILGKSLSIPGSARHCGKVSGNWTHSSPILLPKTAKQRLRIGGWQKCCAAKVGEVHVSNTKQTPSAFTHWKKYNKQGGGLSTRAWREDHKPGKKLLSFPSFQLRKLQLREDLALVKQQKRSPSDVCWDQEDASASWVTRSNERGLKRRPCRDSSLPETLRAVTLRGDTGERKKSEPRQNKNYNCYFGVTPTNFLIGYRLQTKVHT